mgnify:FL=1
MIILYLPKFARQYKKLPTEIQDTAEKKEKVFRKNPFDPRLKTHKLTGPLDGFYAFSINHKYRIIFDLADQGTARFYSVGDHNIYDK